MTGYDAPPEEVELSLVEIGGWDELGGSGNTMRVQLRFGDGTFMQVQFAEDSHELAEVIELLTQQVNETLRRRGLTGIEITGLTPIDEEDE